MWEPGSQVPRENPTLRGGRRSKSPSGSPDRGGRRGEHFCCFLLLGVAGCVFCLAHWSGLVVGCKVAFAWVPPPLEWVVQYFKIGK